MRPVREQARPLSQKERVLLMSAFDEYPPLPDTLEESYPMTCANCKFKQRACPSLMMQAFGLNTGAGNCLNCKEHLHLWISDGVMKSELYSVLAEKVRDEVPRST